MDRSSPDIVSASDGYARRFAGPLGAYLLEVQTRFTLQLLEPYRGERVVDVGGGHAQLAAPLVERGWDVTVTGSAAACRTRLDRLLPAGSFHFVESGLQRLPFADGEFGVALSFRTLAHVADWEALLAELCRVARRAVVFDYPDRRSFNFWGAALLSWKRSVEPDVRPFRCLARGAVAASLARRGFTVAARRPQFLWPLALHRALGRAGISRALEGVARGAALTRALGSPVIVLAQAMEPGR